VKGVSAMRVNGNYEDIPVTYQCGSVNASKP